MKYTLVVADDQEENLYLTTYMLKKLGSEYRILHAHDGKEALELVQEELPDLVLLDWDMPVMTGIECLKQLKTGEETADIPVIILTGLEQSEHLEKAFNAGASDYLRKPFDVLELLARVRSSISLYDSYRQIMSQKEQIVRQNQIIVEQNNRLAMANEELESFSQLKDRLFSLLSHDIKSPLNTLTVLLKTFIKYTDSFSVEDLRTHAIDVNTSLEQVYQLIERLLNWSMAQLGQVTFEPEVYSIEQVLSEPFALAKAQAAEKGLEIEVKGPQETELFADAEMMGFVLRNLLSNAVKFSYPGQKIIIGIQPGNKALTLEVKDTGMGIPPEELEKIRTSQALVSRPGTAKEKGTGFGLLLIREYLKLHEAELQVESELEKGSTFKVVLPPVPV